MRLLRVVFAAARRILKLGAVLRDLDLTGTCGERQSCRVVSQVLDTPISKRQPEWQNVFVAISLFSFQVMIVTAGCS